MGAMVQCPICGALYKLADSDDLAPDVEVMQAATLRVRAALAPKGETGQS